MRCAVKKYFNKITAFYLMYRYQIHPNTPRVYFN